MSSALRARVLMSVLALALVGLGACHRRTLDDEAKALDQRLMSPCCWKQTIADHDSPTAHELRAEIRRRLQTGEDPDAIEAAFIERYGPRIRALGEGGGDPRGSIGLATAIATLAGLGLVAVITARLVRRGRAASTSAAPTAAGGDDARAADRLDDELAATE